MEFDLVGFGINKFLPSLIIQITLPIFGFDLILSSLIASCSEAKAGTEE